MSGVANSIGWYNLPAQAVSGSSETGIIVPASGYALLPSPAQPALNASAVANELYVGLQPMVQPTGLSTAQQKDLVTTAIFDARMFYLRVSGKVHGAASENVTVKTYAVPAAGVLLGGAMHSATGATLVGTTGTMATGGAGDFSFYMECEIMWDSVSKNLSSIQYGLTLGGAAIARGANSQQAAYGSLNDLNFVSTVTFSSANAANTIALAEFVVEQ